MAFRGSVQLVSVSFRSSPLATPRSCSPANRAEAPAPARPGAPSPPRSPGAAETAEGAPAARSPGPRGPPEPRSPTPSSSARSRQQHGSARTAAAHFRPAEPGPPSGRAPGNAATAAQRFLGAAPGSRPGRGRCRGDAHGRRGPALLWEHRARSPAGWLRGQRAGVGHGGAAAVGVGLL